MLVNLHYEYILVKIMWVDYFYRWFPYSPVITVVFFVIYKGNPYTIKAD